MGGFFGVASESSCVLDLFFGTDYHSHLGTKRGGMAVYGPDGFSRAIHNIENSPFRTKFERDVEELEGNMGIGCISDSDPQPLLVQSHLGSFAITTVGKVNNAEELIRSVYENGCTHFLEMSGSRINTSELMAALISQKSTIVEGLQYMQERVDGSMSVLLLTADGIYAARDRWGRTPLAIGCKEGAYCVSFEDFAFGNLGYTRWGELGPGEIVRVTSGGVERLVKPRDQMKICTFLWVYYGYPTSSYEGVNVEEMRYKCGVKLAERDNADCDLVAGVPDSGTAHAIGYANRSGIPFGRPFIKYTPTWPRSFMPPRQAQRDLIARMKLIPVEAFIRDKSLLLIDDSIVRGTQLRETTEFLYRSGAKAVHVRPACPPILYGCKYLNFSRSNSDMELFGRRVINELEGRPTAGEGVAPYTDPDSPCYKKMVDKIREVQNFTSLQFQRLDDLIASVGIEPCKLCTYCWNGKE